jgi:hypothetical protein
VDADTDGAAEGPPLERAVAFPAGTDVLALARAWFLEAEQLREPSAARPRRLVGARFGGVADAAAAVVPGVLQVSPGVRLRGPQPPSAIDEPLPATVEDVYLAEGTGDELFAAWCLAAAGHVGGSVVDAVGQVVSVRHDELVGLSLFASELLDTDAALQRARTVAPMMRLARPEPDGSAGLALDTPYDGTLLLRLGAGAQPPVALSWLPEDAYGPCAYEVSWVPPDAAAATAGSVVGRLARDRIVPLVARLVLALQESVGGTVVDLGGFVVPIEDVRRRAAR